MTMRIVFVHHGHSDYKPDCLTAKNGVRYLIAKLFPMCYDMRKQTKR